ncbi:MAG: hypothetical protein HYT22_01575 [Candidatus Niyogibacteria bacterium]|nr:hypothetical protein [Candidatus Niyogibacteria bacterium]
MLFSETLGVVAWEFFGPVIRFFIGLWWIPVLIVVAVLTHDLFLFWRQSIFRKKIVWTLLEILIPREIRKSPKAMEQLLEQLASLRNSPSDWHEKYVKGEVTRPFSLEAVSFGGEIHFYIRAPAAQRNIVESFLYSNYKDIEVVEAADYVDRLPSETRELYSAGMDMFGMELKLKKDAAYPLRTYIVFESIEEEKALDPMSTLVEELSRIKKEEHLWVQLVIRPADTEWQKRGQAVVKELKEKSISKAKVAGDIEGLATITRSPGETAMLEAIEKNLIKPGFDTIIRSMYFAPRASFNLQFAQRGVRSAFNQYAGLNRFSYNLRVWTLVKWVMFPYIFIRRRAEARKQNMLHSYRTRAMPEERWIGRFLNSNLFFWNSRSKSVAFVLNTEALATIFHPPSFLVLTAPFIKQVEAKRLGPPAGLPIFGEGEELPGLAIPGQAGAEKSGRE